MNVKRHGGAEPLEENATSVQGKGIKPKNKGIYYERPDWDVVSSGRVTRGCEMAERAAVAAIPGIQRWEHCEFGSGYFRQQ